jgi:purine-nucleoside phosphorylase
VSSPARPDDRLAEEAVALIRERSDVQPAVALVLGSGLGDAVAGDVRAEHELVFGSLPGFPPPSVPGHAGKLVLGTLYGAPAAVFGGRIHFYEGHGIGATTLIPRICAGLGARTLVLTNAAGGLDPGMRPASLMLIEDHMNFMGVNPLTGWRFPDGTPAFIGLEAVYSPKLRALAEEAALDAGVELRRGVYAAMAGPSYETPAETAALARLGAHAVGMSTVPEAVSAVALGLAVLGISCITNVTGVEVSHEDVVSAAGRAAPALRAILSRVVPQLGGGTAGDATIGKAT